MTLNFISICGQICSGKGTLSNGLKDNFPNSKSISYGFIYRQAKEKIGEYAVFYEDIEPHIKSVDSGILLPDLLTLRIVTWAIEKGLKNNKSTFILDGFPRNIHQLNLFENWILEHKNNFDAKIQFININSDKEIIMGRLKKRLAEADDSGIKRIDDVGANFTRRLENYPQFTVPMTDMLRLQNKIIDIDGTGSPEQVLEASLKAIVASAPA